jgi:hypothetical protein
MLGRRKPLHKWTPVEVVADVETAFFGDSDQRNVRAAVVLKYAYERLTKADRAVWEADAAAEFGDRGLPTHGVFKFDFDDGDRMALFMDHDKSVLVRDVEAVFGVEQAVVTAVAWVGEPHTEAVITNIPGVYQAALIEAVTGVERAWNEEDLGWWLPGDGPPYIYRKYPPPANEDVSFVVMAVPDEIRQARYRAFLLSPTWESEFRSRRRLFRR